MLARGNYWKIKYSRIVSALEWSRATVAELRAENIQLNEEVERGQSHAANTTQQETLKKMAALLNSLNPQ